VGGITISPPMAATSARAAPSPSTPLQQSLLRARAAVGGLAQGAAAARRREGRRPGAGVAVAWSKDGRRPRAGRGGGLEQGAATHWRRERRRGEIEEGWRRPGGLDTRTRSLTRYTNNLIISQTFQNSITLGYKNFSIRGFSLFYIFL
jgi:hypothetical protein